MWVLWYVMTVPATICSYYNIFISYHTKCGLDARKILYMKIFFYNTAFFK